ncbi:MAG: NUDIX hydrolase [Chloroflexota bacterium]
MPASDQGSPNGRYTLVPRTLIFLTRGDKLLLLRGAPHKRLWAGLYNGLGGHIEQGEDVLGSAQRELAEETGLAAVDLRLCGVITIDTGAAPGIGIYVLRGECLQGEPVASAEGAAEWVDCRDLPNLPLVEDLHQLLPRLLTMQPGDPPFSAHYGYDAHGQLLISFYPPAAG